MIKGKANLQRSLFVWIRHCYDKLHVFLVLKIGMIHTFSYFLCFEEHFKRNFIQSLLYFIYIVHKDQINKLLLILIS